jgi:Concanavalin A-like lectin/glucanases superfamily
VGVRCGALTMSKFLSLLTAAVLALAFLPVLALAQTITPVTAPSSAYFSSGSVSWWMKPSSAFNSGTIRGIWGQGDSSEFSCQIFTDNNWYCGWSTSADRRVIIAASAVNYPTNVWSYYTLVWNSAGTTLYRNGVSIGTNGTGPATANLSGSFLIGKQGINNQYFPGSEDDFRIYNRALSAAEVYQLYKLGH